MPKKRLLIGLVLVILGAFIFWKGVSAYQEAKTHLTPASVSVSGYTRRDGTYVRPYNRRPPGGAIHDRPYKDAMFLYSLLMLVGGGLVILPIGMMLRGKTQKKLSQESPSPLESSVLLKCASRQHTLRLDSNRFWQKTLCPKCKVRWSRFDGHGILFNNRQINDEENYYDHHDRRQAAAQIR